MKYISTFFVFLGIWVTASLFNGLLSGICISVFDSQKFGSDSFSLAALFSFIYSIPLVGLVWLTATIAQLMGKEPDAVFQTVLTAAIFSALAGGLFFIIAFDDMFNESRYAVACCVMIAAVCTVLLFRPAIKGSAPEAASNEINQSINEI